MVKNNDYDNLREEILYSRKAQDTFTMFLYTSVITILGFAFELQNLYLFLLPIIIIVPVAIKVADYRRTIAYIAAYMILFLENDYNKWETDNFEFSKIYPRKGMEKLIHILENYDAFFLNVVCASVFIGMVVYNIISSNLTNLFLDIILSIIAIFTCVLIFIVTRTYSDYQNLKVLKLSGWLRFNTIKMKEENENE